MNDNDPVVAPEVEAGQVNTPAIVQTTGGEVETAGTGDMTAGKERRLSA